jgi:hypothetical protein
LSDVTMYSLSRDADCGVGMGGELRRTMGASRASKAYSAI